MPKQYSMSEIDALEPQVSAVIENIGMLLLSRNSTQTAGAKYYEIDGNSLKVVFSKAHVQSKEPYNPKVIPTQATLMIPGVIPHVISLTHDEYDSTDICEETLKKITKLVVKLIKQGAVRVTMSNLGMRQLITDSLNDPHCSDISKRFKGMIEGGYSDKGYTCRLYGSDKTLLKEKLIIDGLVDPSDRERNLEFNKKSLADTLYHYVTEGMVFTNFYSDYKHSILTKGN